MRAQVVWGSVLGPLSSLSTKRSEGTSVPLMNEPPDVPARTPINSNLRLGLTAADALTPVGRGQSMMVESTNPTFRSAVGVNAILAQRTTGVRTVLASVSRGGSNDDAAAMALGRLRAQQSTDNAPCVVAAPSNATVVERFLAACAACSIGESVRDSGGDALVVVDDLSVLSDMWDLMSDKWNAFMKDEWEAERSTKYEKLQVQDLPAAATAAESAVEEEADAAEEKPKRPVAGSPEEMVDFGGTLVPVEVAERRSFFSMFLQVRCFALVFAARNAI
jgi:F-type H+-transporting ATPase subunit alpha